METDTRDNLQQILRESMKNCARCSFIKFVVFLSFETLFK